MSGPNERDELAALIAEHRPGDVTTALNEAWIGCSCSERVPVPVQDLKMAWGDAYRAQEEHVADAILASDWLAERDRRTAATAVREAGIVTPAYIAEQRELGWPDIHPEDHCHRCGVRNMLWYADSNTWQTATAKIAAATGREGIYCPRCFAELHAEATGTTSIWHLSTEEPQ